MTTNNTTKTTTPVTFYKAIESTTGYTLGVFEAKSQLAATRKARAMRGASRFTIAVAVKPSTELSRAIDAVQTARENAARRVNVSAKLAQKRLERDARRRNAQRDAERAQRAADRRAGFAALRAAAKPTKSTARTLTAALRAAGRPETVVQGRGYVYLVDGDASAWYSSSIPVARTSDIAIDNIVSLRDELATDKRNSDSALTFEANRAATNVAQNVARAVAKTTTIDAVVEFANELSDAFVANGNVDPAEAVRVALDAFIARRSR